MFFMLKKKWEKEDGIELLIFEQFTKIDLKQEYNNIRIKKGNKQKTAFSTLEGVSELIVNIWTDKLTNNLLGNNK